MIKKEKIYDTGLRILEVLKILLYNSVTKNELISKLKDNNQIEGVYTQEAFIKYFNTLESLGLNVNKEKTRYHISNALEKLNLTNKEQQILITLLSNLNKLNNKEEEELLEKVIFKLNKFVNMDLNAEYSKIKNQNIVKQDSIKEKLVSTLKNYLYDKQAVSITYKKNNVETENIIVELQKIQEQNNNFYVIFYNRSTGSNRKISVDSIVSINQLPNKSSGYNYMNSVVFELYGRLMNSYKLKESEKVIDFDNNHITISNSLEDKESLLLRLLKYGENCKIIRPKSLQEEFLQLVDDITKNLEIKNENDSIYTD